ncbi:hypothetical protein DFH09DRAFT_1095561 [Mycena vulgaris]|nr:hypothetical protein DFH09DRAFT_1095561 [Mycena vulgaris]
MPTTSKAQLQSDILYVAENLMAASVTLEDDPAEDIDLLGMDEEEAVLLADDIADALELAALNWMEIAQCMTGDGSWGTYDKIPKSAVFFSVCLRAPDREFRHMFRIGRDMFDYLVKELSSNIIFHSTGRRPQRHVKYQLGQAIVGMFYKTRGRSERYCTSFPIRTAPYGGVVARHHQAHGCAARTSVHPNALTQNFAAPRFRHLLQFQWQCIIHCREALLHAGSTTSMNPSISIKSLPDGQVTREHRDLQFYVLIGVLCKAALYAATGKPGNPPFPGTHIGYPSLTSGGSAKYGWAAEIRLPLPIYGSFQPPWSAARAPPPSLPRRCHQRRAATRFPACRLPHQQQINGIRSITPSTAAHGIPCPVVPRPRKSLPRLTRGGSWAL